MIKLSSYIAATQVCVAWFDARVRHCLAAVAVDGNQEPNHNYVVCTSPNPLSRVAAYQTVHSNSTVCQNIKIIEKSYHYYCLCTLFKILKKELLDLSLSDCSSPCLILTKSPQISGQNKSEACKPEELVKITNVFLRMEIFALAGNSN